jgi:SagB-type dehydrogenase family enzyme
MEAGHIAQNIYLVASSLGLGSCAVGAFDDDGFNKIIGVDGKSETVIYLMVVGKI